jgi:hypothetical protein
LLLLHLLHAAGRGLLAETKTRRWPLGIVGSGLGESFFEGSSSEEQQRQRPEVVHSSSGDRTDALVDADTLRQSELFCGDAPQGVGWGAGREVEIEISLDKVWPWDSVEGDGKETGG